MVHDTDPKSMVVTLALVVVAAVITAFVAGWAQYMIIGRTYVAVTMGLALAAAFVVISSRRTRHPR